jgi:hypothetical protein
MLPAMHVLRTSLSGLLVLVVAACSNLLGTSASNWGPLVVYRHESHNDALIRGTLEITDRCTYIVLSDGQRGLVAWPDDATHWDSVNRTVMLGATRLQDGTDLSIGGSGMPFENGTSRQWVSPPNPECQAGFIWVASPDVTVGGGN